MTLDDRVAGLEKCVVEIGQVFGQATDAIISYTQRIEATGLLDPPVLWICAHCGAPHECPVVIWPYVCRFLVCQTCGSLQNYPGYIQPNFEVIP